MLTRPKAGLTSMTNQEFNVQMAAIEKKLFASALRLTRNEEDAKDLFQETIFRAFRHKDGFREGTNFTAWILTILRNGFINEYRKKRKRNHINQPEDITNFAIDSRLATDNLGEENISIEELYRIIEQLGPLYSVPFLLFFKGYSYLEIGEELNIPLGTVKSRIFLARTKIQRKLQLTNAAQAA